MAPAPTATTPPATSLAMAPPVYLQRRWPYGGGTTASGNVTYSFNAQGQRAAKSDPGALVPTGQRYYVYDQAGQLLGEYDANGAPIYETIYLGALPVGVIKHTRQAANNDLAAVLYNLHTDHIATPRIISRQDQVIVWRWDAAEGFGANGPKDNPVRWAPSPSTSASLGRPSMPRRGCSRTGTGTTTAKSVGIDSPIPSGWGEASIHTATSAGSPLR